MSNSSRIVVVAVGPSFRGRRADQGRRRVVLLKRPQNPREPQAFVVAIERMKNDPRDRPRLRKRAVTRHFSHAVRIFCDLMLELAHFEDVYREEEEASRLLSAGHEMGDA
jgi:hypothetical protein